MKKTWIAIGLCAGCLAGAAELNWSSMEAPWKKNDKGEFVIDYPNQKWPKLLAKQQVKAGTFYKVTFDCKRDGESVPDVYVGANDGTGNLQAPCCTFNDWATQCAYFPAFKDGTMRVFFGFNPVAPAKLTAKNGKFEEVTPEMMKQNLIPNGNFEDESVKGTAIWKSENWKERTFPGKVVTGQDFLNGEKSLELPFGKGVKTLLLPMRKGKTYQFTFWAKGTKNGTGMAGFSLWGIRGHKGKHFWKGQSFKLETTWKEYKFEATIPTDEKLYPDVKDETGEVFIGVNGSEGKYYLDDISCREK